MVDLNNLKYNKPLITREILRKELVIYEVYAFYLGKNFKTNDVFQSPFRKDNIPSFGIFENSEGELIYNDFALGGGDVFTFVKYLFQYRTWWEVYSRIAIDFWLDAHYLCKTDMIKTTDRKKIKYYEQPKINDKKITLDVRIRKWNIEDKKYWKAYGLSLDTLKHYKVFPISHIFFNTDNKQKIIKADKIAYCYVEIKDNIKTYKIYQPYSKYKWINNHDFSVWQGWSNLPTKCNMLVITKSLKDVMCLTQIFQIPSIALQSEKTKPKGHIIADLKYRFNTIYLLYDNDFDKEENYGQIFAEKLCNEFNFKNIMIPSRYQCKDFSDLIKKYGKIKANSILKKLIEQKENNNIMDLLPNNEVLF